MTTKLWIGGEMVYVDSRTGDKIEAYIEKIEAERDTYKTREYNFGIGCPISGTPLKAFKLEVSNRWRGYYE